MHEHVCIVSNSHVLLLRPSPTSAPPGADPHHCQPARLLRCHSSSPLQQQEQKEGSTGCGSGGGEEAMAERWRLQKGAAANSDRSCWKQGPVFSVYWTYHVMLGKSGPSPNLPSQENFVQKAELVIESRREVTMRVEAGWYSERSMAQDLGWTPYLGCIVIIHTVLSCARASMPNNRQSSKGPHPCGQSLLFVNERETPHIGEAGFHDRCKFKIV